MLKKASLSFLVPALLYALLGLALSHTLGNYRTGPLLTVFLVWFSFSVQGFWGAKNHVALAVSVRTCLLFVFAVFALRMAHQPRLQYLENGFAYTLLRISVALGGILSVFFFFQKTRGLTYFLIPLTALTSRVLTLFASPHPKIDVFSTVSHAAEYLLHRQNPYSLPCG